MTRKINITNTTQESKNHFQKVNLYPETSPCFDGYFNSFAENVFFAAREGITTGKIHDMFMAGDGHELEDYTDEQGRFHLAHAKSIFSSSMLAYNFFYWVSPEFPLTLDGTTYDKVYFEVKFPVMEKTTEGRPVNRPSNMDVVLISDDCLTMLCIESKYTEHTHKQKAEFSDAYFKPSCYYQGNPYRASFIQMALHYNEKGNGYFAGIKQNISHLIGITNVMHDADALAWFKANNPFIEPEVMEKIGAHTEFIFTNLLYCHPELGADIYGDIHAEEKNYPYLLAELLFDHLQRSLDEPLLLSSFIKTYHELFRDLRIQMHPAIAEYLDNRYVLTKQPHFPLPEGYDTASHYLIDVVMDGAKERYKENFTDEVTTRIQCELKSIRVHRWAERLLILWDLIRAVHEHGFCTSPGANRTAGSIVAYCLGITDIEPLGSHLSEKEMMYRATFPNLYIEFSTEGKKFAQQYLLEKYGILSFKVAYNDYPVINIVEQTIAASGQHIDFQAIPYDTEEQVQFFMSDENWRQYSYFGQDDMRKLHAIEHPTFEDIVRIFSIRSYPDGTTNIFPREHCYGRCVLAMRAAWLKMHYPEEFRTAVVAQEQRKNITGIPSGFDEIDAITRGWQKSDLIVIGARPAVGKTSFMISMAREMGLHGYPVAIISLEMSNKQMVNRLIMNTFSVSQEEMKDGKWKNCKRKDVADKLDSLKKALIYLDDTLSLSITELVYKACTLVYEKGIKLIFIDYLQLLSATGFQYENREQEISIIVRELKKLAKKLHIPIIALSQLNRKEDNILPQINDIRGSRDIAEVADVVCLMHRPKNHELVQIIVAKNHGDKIGDVELHFNKRYARFESLSK